MLKTILVATDGSENAAKAVAIGSDLAVKHGAHLVLLHVVTGQEVSEKLMRFAAAEEVPGAGSTQHVEPMQVGPPDMLVPQPVGTKEQMDRRVVVQMISDRILEEAKSLATQRGVSSVEVMTGQGNPHSAILRSARNAHADAIVVGSRGISNIKEVYLGSVSHKVAHDAAQEAARTCITVT